MAFASECAQLVQEAMEKGQWSLVVYQCQDSDEAKTHVRWAKEIFEPKGYTVKLRASWTTG